MNIPWAYLDKKIIPLVRFLNTNGIESIQSCQGHKKPNVVCYPGQPWVEISKKSFKNNFNLLNESLHFRNFDGWHCSYGSLYKVYRGPKHIDNFDAKYDIVFWNLDCVNDFIKRFEKLKNES